MCSYPIYPDTILLKNTESFHVNLNKPNIGRTYSQENTLPIPDLVIKNIFFYLSNKELAYASIVCRNWKIIIDENQKLRLKKSNLDNCYFGEEKWKKHFDTIDVEPLLPQNIETILNTPCPFWPGKKVRNTHLLVLVPQRVNNEMFHLDKLSKLIKKPKYGHKTQYQHYDNDVQEELGTKSLPSRWILMTKDVIPKTQGRTYEDQKNIIKQYSEEGNIFYEPPETLEVATAILTHYIETGNRLYETTYTRCKELVSNDWPVIIGGFSDSGLKIDDDLYWVDNPSLGMTGYAKWPIP